MAGKKGRGGAAAKKPAAGGGKKRKGAVELPRTQRKIFHLLDSTGAGDTFKYFNKINRKSGFKEGDNVFLTEKWDGTTVQATNRGIYKRIDKFKKGDPRKHAAPESERYELREVNVDGGQDKWIGRAVRDYEDTFRSLPDGVCVYFEAVGTCIGSRFSAHDEYFDIRVFDFAKDNEFLPFDETLLMADDHSLPLVHYTEDELCVERVVTLLSAPNFGYEGMEDVPCEGFVVRGVADSTNVAKIRVEDLVNLHEAHY